MSVRLKSTEDFFYPVCACVCMILVQKSSSVEFVLSYVSTWDFAEKITSLKAVFLHLNKVCSGKAFCFCLRVPLDTM